MKTAVNGYEVGPGADLEGANLRSADLRSADLGGANLEGANLRSADLGKADLPGAYLRDANLRDADLGGASLGGANLRDADLEGADLGGALGIIRLSFSHRWELFLVQQSRSTPMVKCGCHWFTVVEAIKHWENHIEQQRQDVVLPALNAGLMTAKAQGWKV